MYVCGYPTHVPHSYNAVMVILILWVNGLVVTCISRMAAFSPTGVARGFSLFTPRRTQWHSMMFSPFFHSPLDTAFAYTFVFAYTCPLMGLLARHACHAVSSGVEPPLCHGTLACSCGALTFGPSRVRVAYACRAVSSIPNHPVARIARKRTQDSGPKYDL